MIINKNYGFTLIEIVIVLMIISLISFSLYQMLNQASKTVARSNQIIDTDLPIIPLYNQLELDITGMFAPQATAIAYLEKLKPEKKGSSDDKKEKSSSDDKGDKEDKGSLDNKLEENKENKKEHIKDIFYVKANESGNITLSFITTTGIKRLDTDGSLKPSSFIYRVAYILQKDPQKPDTFEIIYKCDSESKLLDVKNILDSKFEPTYRVMSGIKDLKIKFTLYEFKEVEKKDTDNKVNKTEQPEKKEPTNITLSEWQEEENFKKYKALIPAYISFEGTFLEANNRKNIEHKFNFEFKVPAYIAYL